MTLFQLLENLKQQLLKMRLQLQFPKIYFSDKIEGIIFHHGGGDWSFAQVNNGHREKRNDISSLGFYTGYQYFIEFSGLKYQARRNNEEGMHTVGPMPHYYNRGWIGVCVQGNTNLKDMTESQKRVAFDLINELKEKYKIPNSKILGHREVSLNPTDCPGKYGWAFLVAKYPS